MMSRKRWKGTAIPGVRLFAALAMVLTMLAGTALPIAAQGSVDVAIYTVENGQSNYDACYILVGYSEVGCDENGDGKVTFAAIPYGTYTVRQTANLGAGRSVADFTITVTGNVNAEGYEGFTATVVVGSGSSAGAGSSGYSDVAIEPTENGQPIYDACFVIVDYSEVGCDENRDGKITFEDIPLGTHTVRQTADLGPGRSIADFTINVTGAASADGWERFPATIVGGSGGASGYSDIAIVTTENGQPVYDACYIIVDYSEVGCDENRDGKITFEDIPLGRWTVRQTANLGPGRSVADFTIQVTGAASGDGWERFPATIGGTGGGAAPGAVDVALITRDPGTGGLLTGTCYVLVGYSNQGCDENGDGQVTFDAIPFGTYTVHQTRTPAGYPTINDYEIHVEPIQAVESTELVGYPLSFVVKQAPEQNAPNTRNVSVVLIDSRTGERVQDEFCLEIVGVSNIGCDNDLPDGQIDFLDVASGGPYEINFTKIPLGYDVDLTFDGGPWLVIVNDDPGDPANKMAFVFVSSPASTSGAAGGTASTSGSAGTSTAGMDWRTMVIGCMDPVVCYGAEIVVTKDGAPVGSCTITTDPNDTSHVHACAVDVPVGVTIQLHLDESTLSPGYMVTENDVSFETTYVGKRASHDYIFDVVPKNGAQG